MYTHTQIHTKKGKKTERKKAFSYLYDTFPSAGTPNSSDNWG